MVGNLADVITCAKFQDENDIGWYYNAGLLFSSGLAVTTVITNLLSAGDHIICTDDSYGGWLAV